MMENTINFDSEIIPKGRRYTDYNKSANNYKIHCVGKISNNELWKQRASVKPTTKKMENWTHTDKKG